VRVSGKERYCRRECDPAARSNGKSCKKIFGSRYLDDDTSGLAKTYCKMVDALPSTAGRAVSPVCRRQQEAACAPGWKNALSGRSNGRGIRSHIRVLSVGLDYSKFALIKLWPDWLLKYRSPSPARVHQANAGSFIGILERTDARVTE